MTKHSTHCPARTVRRLMGLLALAAAPTAWPAMTVQGTERAAIAPRSLTAAPAVADIPGSSQALDLQSAVVDAVDLEKRLLTLNGRSVALDPTLRIVADGRSLGASLGMLRSGQRIRFALQPGGGANAPRRIVLIYLDR